MGIPLVWKLGQEVRTELHFPLLDVGPRVFAFFSRVQHPGEIPNPSFLGLPLVCSIKLWDVGNDRQSSLDTFTGTLPSRVSWSYRLFLQNCAQLLEGRIV